MLDDESPATGAEGARRAAVCWLSKSVQPESASGARMNRKTRMNAPIRGFQSGPGTETDATGGQRERLTPVARARNEAGASVVSQFEI